MSQDFLCYLRIGFSFNAGHIEFFKAPSRTHLPSYLPNAPVVAIWLLVYRAQVPSRISISKTPHMSFFRFQPAVPPRSFCSRLLVSVQPRVFCSPPPSSCCFRWAPGTTVLGFFFTVGHPHSVSWANLSTHIFVSRPIRHTSYGPVLRLTSSCFLPKSSALPILHFSFCFPRRSCVCFVRVIAKGQPGEPIAVLSKAPLDGAATFIFRGPFLISRATAPYNRLNQPVQHSFPIAHVSWSSKVSSICVAKGFWGIHVGACPSQLPSDDEDSYLPPEWLYGPIFPSLLIGQWLRH